MSPGLPSTLWWWVNGSNFNIGCITLPLYCPMLPHNLLLVYPIQRDVGWDCAAGNKAAFHVVSVWIVGQKMNPAETVLRYPALKTLCMTWVELMAKITTWTYISSKNQLELARSGRGLWLVLQPVTRGPQKCLATCLRSCQVGHLCFMINDAYLVYLVCFCVNLSIKQEHP